MGSDAHVTDEAVLALMASNFEALNAVKNREFQWLERFTILVAPIIGFFAVRGQGSLLPVSLVGGLLVGYLAITLWFHWILEKERLGYYRLLRSALRCQNMLGFFKVGFLSPHFANSAFPKGFGANKSLDGTQPFSSFLHRQLYVLIFFVGVAAASVYQRTELAPLSVGLVILDIIWLVLVFVHDGKRLQDETASEENLAGWDHHWSRSEDKASRGV